MPGSESCSTQFWKQNRGAKFGQAVKTSPPIFNVFFCMICFGLGLEMTRRFISTNDWLEAKVGGLFSESPSSQGISTPKFQRNMWTSNDSPLMVRNPKGKDRLPTINFQGLWWAMLALWSVFLANIQSTSGPDLCIKDSYGPGGERTSARAKKKLLLRDVCGCVAKWKGGKRFPDVRNDMMK